MEGRGATHEVDAAGAPNLQELSHDLETTRRFWALHQPLCDSVSNTQVDAAKPHTTGSKNANTD